MAGHAAIAAVTDGLGGFSVRDVTVRSPGPGEVMVAIAAAGVCHTDWDAVGKGEDNLILGHEGAGTVVEVGDGVIGISVGDRVLLTWAIACGTCLQCARGNEVLCEVLGWKRGSAVVGTSQDSGARALQRFFTLGTMSTLTVVRAEAIVPIPASMPFPQAALLGCAVMTGYGSVVNAAKVPAGSSVVVIGCGGVGLNVIQAARLAGARRILAVDRDDRRFRAAQLFGATDSLGVVDDQDDELLRTAQAARAMMEGGWDYAFECTGVPTLALSPLAFVRDGGTAIQVSGVEQRVSVDLELFEWDKTYLNPLYGQCRPRLDFPTLIELYELGRLRLDEQITRTYPLRALEYAFADLMAGKNCKGVITLG